MPNLSKTYFPQILRFYYMTFPLKLIEHEFYLYTTHQVKIAI